MDWDEIPDGQTKNAWQIKCEIAAMNLEHLNDWEKSFVQSVIEKYREPSPKQYAAINRIMQKLSSLPNVVRQLHLPPDLKRQLEENLDQVPPEPKYHAVHVWMDRE